MTSAALTLRGERRDASLFVTGVLASGALAILALEGLRDRLDGGAAALLLLECVIGLAALVLTWTRQEHLRLVPLLGLALFFHGALVLLHLRLSLPGDWDVEVVYPRDGNAFLDGTYPDSAYPPGAVTLFGIEVLLGDGRARTTNALLMIPFNLLLVASLWSLRTSTSRWLAAVAVLSPATMWFWEFRFDLAPAALLVVGLALARRQRWHSAAIVLAVGSWVKWTPGLAAVGIAVWLLGRGSQRKRAATFSVAFLAAVTSLHAPFLLRDADAVLGTLTAQGDRGLTAESLPFLPLRALGLAEMHPSGFLWQEATRPDWADGASTVAQLAVVAAVLALAATARTRGAALAVAALLPGVFLLTNRVFSPQFVVVIAAGWLAAGALGGLTRGRQLALVIAMTSALTANMLVFPISIEAWLAASTALFALALGITAALLWLTREASTVATGGGRIGERER